MSGILVASSSQQGQSLLRGLLCQAGYRAPSSASCGSEARRMLAENEFELVIINAPLSDEFGHELAARAAGHGSAGVVLLVKSESADEVSARVEEAGVLVVGKPVVRPLFFQALKLAAASRRRLLGLRGEIARLQGKLEEARLVGRAKCALIQYRGMTEPQAHRYIEKQAMDRRATRRQVAEGILSAFGA